LAFQLKIVYVSIYITYISFIILKGFKNKNKEQCMTEAIWGPQRKPKIFTIWPFAVFRPFQKPREHWDRCETSRPTLGPTGKRPMVGGVRGSGGRCYTRGGMCV
jgi:hypothetical protein